MKRILYIMCAMLVFASCNKESLPTTSGQNPDGSYTFNIGIEEPDYAPQTRAVAIGRYMLEMYEGNLAATPVKMSNTTGRFNVELKRDVDYVCLFWADDGTAAYDVSSLKAVKQTQETALGTVAYCACVTGNSNRFDGATFMLQHAVAELSFIDKSGLRQTPNTLQITYPYTSATLNVGDGTVTHVAGKTVRTISNITPPAVATTAFAADFILAPTTATGKLEGLKLQLNNEQEKTLAETVIQANYRTKITGDFQPKPRPKPNVGDFYYQDNTFSSTYTQDAQNPCIGIVFVVNNDGKTGKIVSLDEATAYSIVWSTEDIVTNATDQTDGAINTKIIVGLNTYSAANYPAFAWCATKNPPATAGITWYLPAIKELRQLYAAMSGLKWVASGASTGEISDWGDAKAMPNYDVYAAERTAFNNKFTTAQGIEIELSDGCTYWSSTEKVLNSAYLFNSSTGYAGNVPKKLNADFVGVRAVSAF